MFLTIILGFNASRLPSFTSDESSAIQGSYDFLGVNFYTTSVVYSEIHNISDISFYADSDVSTYQVLNYFIKYAKSLILLHDLIRIDDNIFSNNDF